MPASTAFARPFRVTLIMFSTRSDNLGVGALTVSQIKILRDIARDLGRPIMITIVDAKGPRTPYISGPDIRIVDFDRKMMISPWGYFALARQSDMVIDIGAGDSFADIYGAGRLRRMFLLKYLTHLAGTPLVMAPQTIGPFTKPFSKFLAKLSMRLSKIVATRDTMSTNCIREMGLERDVIEASDVALLLPYDPSPLRATGAPLKVGLNVSGLLMNKGYTGKNEFGIALDYHALMRELIRFFLSEGAEVHLVAHVLREGGISPTGEREAEDDYAAAGDLAAEFPTVLVAPPFGSPSEAKTYIAGLDFFMGARMHACIAAFSAGVAVIPMAYSRKFAGLFGSIGFNRTVDCTAETAEAIIEKVRVGWADRKQLAGEAQQSSAKGRQRLALYVEQLRQVVSGGDT